MITFAHPLTPTVSYSGELKQSIASYALNYLHEYDVFLVAVDSSHGVGIELMEKGTGTHLGLVTIH
jgi:hypothetical protein